MLTQDEIQAIRTASLKLRMREDNHIKPDKFIVLAKFILDQIKLVFLDSNGNAKSLIELLFSINKIVNMVKDVIAKIKELTA